MKTRIIRVVMNGNRKPVHLITDRAKRYRANSPGPAGPKRCGYCGSTRNVGVDHVNGDESDGAAKNLLFACKSCNAKKAALMKRHGLGKLTRQYNPVGSKRRGSRRDQLEAFGQAIKVMRGQFDGDVSAAVATIRATPENIRSEYTSRTWAARRAIYGPSGRG
jgi:hypothetical protein